MKGYLFFIAAFFLLSTSNAQTNSNPEAVVRKVADYVVANTSFQFVNAKTGEKFSSTKGLTPSADIKAESKLNKWFYSNGVLNIGMVQLSKQTGDSKYSDYAKKSFDFVFSNLDFFEKLYNDKVKAEWASFFSMHNLDACGALAAALVDVNASENKKEYTAYLNKAADYISNKQQRATDRTLVRPDPRNFTLWADDLYMSVPFLARMGALTGNAKYFDDAVLQVENFNRYLYDSSTNLFFHCYYGDVKQNGVAHWGRNNGWVAVAQVELLNYLPANHPKRQTLINLLLRQIVGFSRYQNVSGLWNQLLDKPDSYLETSCTAMFTYAVARAVNEGWIPKTYIGIAKDGWEGLASRINEDGQVRDVCIGTNVSESIRYYYTRPTALNDSHALGAVLLAGTEMIKFMKAEPVKEK